MYYTLELMVESSSIFPLKVAVLGVFNTQELLIESSCICTLEVAVLIVLHSGITD